MEQTSQNPRSFSSAEWVGHVQTLNPLAKKWVSGLNFKKNMTKWAAKTVQQLSSNSINSNQHSYVQKLYTLNSGYTSNPEHISSPEITVLLVYSSFSSILA